MLKIERYYSGIVGARRINAPTYSEAAKDMERANSRILVA